MKARMVLTASALLCAVVIPILVSSPSGAASTVAVRVTDSYTYGAGQNFDHTVCVDGTLLTSLSTTQTTGPYDLSPGNHSVTVLDGLSGDCATGQGITTTVTIPDVDAATLLVYWGSEGLEMTVLQDDLSCTQKGQTRLVVRHAAAIYSDSPGNLMDVTALNPLLSPVTLAASLPLGAQAVNNIAAGSYTGMEFYPTGSPGAGNDAPDLNAPEAHLVTRLFYGGNDGPYGVIDTDIPLAVCQTPTTSSTSTSTSTSTTTSTSTSTTSTTTSTTSSTTTTSTTTTLPPTTTSTTTTTLPPTTTSTTTTTLPPTTTSSTTLPPSSSVAPTSSIAATSVVPTTAMTGGAGTGGRNANAAQAIPATPTYTG